jgi:hypothetical protein
VKYTRPPTVVSTAAWLGAMEKSIEQEVVRASVPEAEPSLNQTPHVSPIRARKTTPPFVVATTEPRQISSREMAG